MAWWLWVIVGVAGAIVLFFVLAWVVGRGLPKGHVTRASMRVRQRPEAVFDLIADVGAYPAWSKINKVVRLADSSGRPVWRQHFGRNSVVTVVSRSERPRVYEQTIEDDAKFFSGRWEYEIAAEGEGCRITLTEHGEVHHAIPRFMMRYMVDPAMYLKGQLKAVAKKFGEEAKIEA